MGKTYHFLQKPAPSSSDSDVFECDRELNWDRLPLDGLEDGLLRTCHSRDLRCLRLCTTSGAAMRRASKSSDENFDRGDDANSSKSENVYIGTECHSIEIGKTKARG
jgi:hypothetical protein